MSTTSCRDLFWRGGKRHCRALPAQCWQCHHPGLCQFLRGANLPEERLRLQGDDTQLSTQVSNVSLNCPNHLFLLGARKQLKNEKVILSDLRGFILIYPG